MIKNVFNLLKNVSTRLPQITNSAALVQYNYTIVRNNHYTSSSLWKSVLSVSNQGSKKGRGRRRGAGRGKDLNVGQEIGEGKIKMEWPGLNVPLQHASQQITIKQVGEDKDRQNKLIELRNKMDKFRRLSIPPNERGWTGNTLNGKSIGEPLPLVDVDYTGFDTRIIEYRVIGTVTSILGKKRNSDVFVVTGNKNGIIGLGSGRGNSARIAMRLAKSSASRRLIYIDRFEDRTLFHNFYQEFYYTKVFAQRMPKGYGLRCHRIIKTLCELAGIKDIYVKVDGAMNSRNIAKAFLYGVLNQKKYVDIANEKRLNVVEMRPEMNNFPVVLARPTEGKTKPELDHDYEKDIDLYLLNNKFRKPPTKLKPFYAEYDSYKRYCKKRDQRKLHLEARIQRLKYMDDDKLNTVLYPHGYYRPKKPVEASDEAVASVEGVASAESQVTA